MNFADLTNRKIPDRRAGVAFTLLLTGWLTLRRLPPCGFELTGFLFIDPRLGTPKVDRSPHHSRNADHQKKEARVHAAIASMNEISFSSNIQGDGNKSLRATGLTVPNEQDPVFT